MKAIVVLWLLAVCCLGTELDLLSPKRLERIFQDLAVKIEKAKEPSDIIDGFKEFCEGFYEGVYEILKWDIRMFGMCYEGFGKTYTDLITFWADLKKLFEHFDLHDLYVLVSNLFSHILSNFASCYVAVGYVTHFLDLFRHLTWEDVQNRLLFTFLTNAFGLFEDIIAFVTCAIRLVPRCAGEAIGQVAYIMLFH